MVASMRRDSPWLALILLTAISTVGFIDRIVMNVLAVPIQAEFELSDTQVGLLTGLAFAVLNVALGIVVARHAERGHRLSLIAVGTLLWSIATAACGMVTSWIQLLFARIGVGVGEAEGGCEVGQARAKRKHVAAHGGAGVARCGGRVQKGQQQAGVALHGARSVHQHQQRQRLLAPLQQGDMQHLAPTARRMVHGAGPVRAAAACARPGASGRVVRQGQGHVARQVLHQDVFAS